MRIVMFEIFLSPTVACSMYLCSICNVEVPHTPFNIQQHESGSKHQKAKNNQLSSIGIGNTFAHFLLNYAKFLSKIECNSSIPRYLCNWYLMLMQWFRCQRKCKWSESMPYQFDIAMCYLWLYGVINQGPFNAQEREKTLGSCQK